MLSFFPRNVLDEILNLIETVFEGFPTYSCLGKAGCHNMSAYSEPISFTENASMISISGSVVNTSCFNDKKKSNDNVNPK